MFNRCWRWRALLARRADGKLTPAQEGMLREHLDRCDQCRPVADADDALHDVLGICSAPLAADKARMFDDRVVAALNAPARAPRIFLVMWTRYRHTILARWRTLPFDFIAQVGGGALAAVTLTSFFLLPALHSGTPEQARAALLSEKLARDSARRSALPVPMETLLNTPSPRAAMLWTIPGRRNNGQQTPPALSPAIAPSSRIKSAKPDDQPQKLRGEKRAALNFGKAVA